MNKKKTNRHSPKCRPKKKSYRIRNWREYNRSLVQRGSLTIWCDEAALTEWVQTQRSGYRGASNTYSNHAIVVALVLKEVYHQTLRGTQGLLQSVLKLLNATTLPVPDYSTLCRPGKSLSVPLCQSAGKEAVHLVIDSTGCKVFGEGEWKVRQHGYSKRRTWRKVHLAIDQATGQIEAAVLSTNATGDGEMLHEVMMQVRRPVRQVSADGAYDTRPCYAVLDKHAEQQGTQITTDHGCHSTAKARPTGETWQRQRKAPDAGSEHTPHPGSWTQEMEGADRLPSAKLGGDHDVPYENHLRRRTQRPLHRESGNRGVRPLSDPEPHESA